MPSPISNTPQIAEQTTSDNGRNLRPVLNATSHFFLEDNIFSQSVMDCFGVKSDTAFATTSKVTFTGTKKILAICQGQLLIQPDSANPDKVNLILKPYKQPINSIAIKYFIYRGLRKSDFFESISVEGISRLKLSGSETSGSELIKFLWAEFNSFYGSDDDSIPEFFEEFVGFPSPDNNQLPKDLIDKYFFKTSQYDEITEEEHSDFSFELPIIPRGMELGSAEGDIGIDIVLSYGDFFTPDDPCPFKFDLQYARENFYTLETSIVHTPYKNRLIKEMCMSFMDIAAFYGMHAYGNGKIHTSSTLPPLETKEEIYNQIQYFQTKNTIYLYIQAERIRSYNFYGNYNNIGESENLKIGNHIASLIEVIYGDNGWPIHKINNPGEEIVLSLLTDNNPSTSLYVHTGQVISENEDNFVRFKNIMIEESEEDSETTLRYTIPVQLSVVQSSSNSICNRLQLVYEGIIFRVKDESEDLHSLKDIDDIFGLIEAGPITTTNNVNELPEIVGNQFQICNFKNNNGVSDIGIIQSKRTTDIISINEVDSLKRVTFETSLCAIRQSKLGNLRSVNSNIETKATGVLSFNPNLITNSYNLNSPYYTDIVSFTDSAEIINGLVLRTIDDSLPSKKILGITESEHLILKNCINTNNIFNSKIFLTNVLYNEEDSFISIEEILYKKYLVNIVGETEEGTLQISSPLEPILVFTIDGFIYNSSNYSVNMLIEKDYIKDLNFEKKQY